MSSSSRSPATMSFKNFSAVFASKILFLSSSFVISPIGDASHCLVPDKKQGKNALLAYPRIMCLKICKLGRSLGRSHEPTGSSGVHFRARDSHCFVKRFVNCFVKPQPRQECRCPSRISRRQDSDQGVVVFCHRVRPRVEDHLSVGFLDGNNNQVQFFPN